MAVENVTSNNPHATASNAGNEPLFGPFNRYRDEIDKERVLGYPVRRFAERVADIAGGARVIMELSMDNDNRQQRRAVADEPYEEDRPLLGINDLWSLQRLAAEALRTLEVETDSVMEWAYDTQTPAGRNHRRAIAPVIAAAAQEVRHG